MIHVRFSTSEFNADTQGWVEMPVAELIADGEEITISGPHADWISPDIAVIDPETTERVTRVDGAERWARLLPLAYRDGELTVDVLEVAGARPAAGAFHYPAAA
jgi:hypothetical protein